MKNKYKDLIEQTFDFPQDEFSVEDNELNLYDIPLMEIIKQYGTPLKVTYLPKISSQIARAKRMFNVAMAKVDYKGAYQESIGGFGGIQHCLIPAPKHIIIDRDKGDNEYYTRLFAKEQSYRAMMRILGY